MFCCCCLEGEDNREESDSDGSESEGFGSTGGVLLESTGTGIATALVATFTRRRGGNVQTSGSAINCHGNKVTVTAVEGLLVLGQVTETQTFVEFDDLVVQAADEVNDLRDDTD